MRCRERLKPIARTSIRTAAAVAIVAAASSACVTTAEKGTSTAAAPEGVILRAGRSIPRGTPDSDYFFSPSMEKVLADFGRSRWTEFGPACSAPEIQIRPLYAFVASDVTFQPESGQPQQGSWTIRYRYERCGSQSIHSALLEANPRAPPVVVRTLVPGESAIPHFMQDKVVETALEVAAQGADRGCRPPRVAETTNPIHVAEGSGPDGTATITLTEVWFISVCGRIERVLVSVTVPRKGNRVNVTARKIREGEALGRIPYFAPDTGSTEETIDFRQVAGEVACAIATVRQVDQERTKGNWFRLIDDARLGANRMCAAAAICDTMDGKPNLFGWLNHDVPGQYNPYRPPGRKLRDWPAICKSVASYMNLLADHEPEFVAGALRTRERAMRQLQLGSPKKQ